jgi:hypothetical protein
MIQELAGLMITSTGTGRSTKDLPDLKRPSRKTELLLKSHTFFYLLIQTL